MSEPKQSIPTIEHQAPEDSVRLLSTKAFIVLLFVGLMLRVLVLPGIGFQTDVVMWQNWALKIRHLGIGHAYDPVAFLSGNPDRSQPARAPLLLVDHPPINLYYLTFVSYLPLNSPYVHPAFNALVKFPGLLFDCVVVLLLAAISRSLRYSESIVRFVVLLYWLNPGFIYHHAFWGLNESMSASVFLGVVLALVHHRDKTAIVLLVASLALKFQMIIFLPVVIAFVLFRPEENDSLPFCPPLTKGRSKEGLFMRYLPFHPLLRKEGTNRSLVHYMRKRSFVVISGLVGGLAVLTYLYIPFIATGTFGGALNVFSGSIGRFPNLTKGAYNVWFLIDGLTGFSVPDTVRLIGGFTPRMIGIVLFGIATLINVGMLIRVCSKDCRLQVTGYRLQEILIFSFALQGYSFFMLPTEMHERYIFYAVTFLPLLAWKSLRNYALFGGMSFVYLANLVLVYNYYHIDWPRATSLHYAISILNILCYGYLWRLYVRQFKSQKVESP